MADQKHDIGADRLGGRGDDFYALLMKAHEGLSFEDSAVLNARLVLLLANQVGDMTLLEESLRRASATVER